MQREGYYHDIRIIAIGLLIGSISLIILSFIQKAIAGFDPFSWRGYFVPFLFGGFSGGLIAYKMIKIRKLNSELQQRVSRLESFLPICSICKKIRIPATDPSKTESWEDIEPYIAKKTKTRFSHGICPDCAKLNYPDFDIYDDFKATGIKSVSGKV